jgi:hypothetical protein
MASQKLGFLQKIDPQKALAAIQKKKGSAPGSASASAPAPAPSPAPTHSPAPAPAARAPALFKALSDRLAKNPALAREVGACLQFDVTSPDASWVVDLTGTGAVRPGTDPKATARFRISDADFAALCKDPQTARDLYQRGALRVDGDVRAAQKLAFLKDLA